MLVCKFGGSSLADAEQFQKVKDIVLADKNRRYVVPSAPGKRGDGDEKVTDLLYEAAAARQLGRPFLHILERIRYRYEKIVVDLGIDIPLEQEFTKIASTMMSGVSRDYVASRGEYLNGLLLAEYLGFPFVDADKVVRFDKNGLLDEEETNSLIADTLAELPNAVIPGFYGADEEGNIHTFSRGGSDITGALVARAVNADV